MDPDMPAHLSRSGTQKDHRPPVLTSGATHPLEAASADLAPSRDPGLTEVLEEQPVMGAA